MCRRAPIVLCALAIALSGRMGEAEAEVRYRAGPIMSGPQLIEPDGVAFAVGTAHEGWRVVRGGSGQLGTALERPGFIPPSTPEQRLLRGGGVTVSASSEGLAFAESATEEIPDPRHPDYRTLVSRQAAAAWGGRPYELGGCGPLDVDGRYVAFAHGCNQANGHRVVIRELASGADAAVVPLPVETHSVGRVEIVGDVLAVESKRMAYTGPDGLEVAVYDWRRGERLYSVRARDRGLTLSYVSLLALRNDGLGLLMIANVDCPARQVLVIPPNGPSRTWPCDARLFPSEIVGDRVLSSFRRPDGYRLVLNDLQGNIVRSVGESISGWSDFDGRRVAVSQLGCWSGTDQVIVLDVDEPEFQPPDLACPLRVGRRLSARVRRGIIPVRLSCPAGCRGKLALLRYEGETAAAIHYDLAPPGGTVALPVRRRLLRHIARFPRPRIRLRASDVTATRLVRFR